MNQSHFGKAAMERSSLLRSLLVTTLGIGPDDAESDGRRRSPARRSSKAVRFSRCGALAALLLAVAGAVLAQAANPPIYSPVLLGSTFGADRNLSLSVPIQARPTGGIASVQPLIRFGHDFSRTPFGSGRYFIAIEAEGLAAYNESGVERTVLNNPSDGLTFWRANWSPDGTRIAWCGGRYAPDDPERTQTETGIYVGDVTRDTSSGNPAALTNVRQLVSGTPTAQVNSNGAEISWTGDQQYLIYRVYTGTAAALYRVSVDTPGAVAERITIGNLPANASLTNPKASPVTGDSRIAFVSYKQSYEIWTVNIPATYNAATDVLPAKQITKSGNIYPVSWFGTAYYDWSPDAAAFVFTQDNAQNYPRVMRVPSAGGSASTLLSGNKVGYTVQRWRN
jgi:hypothetical protein